MVGFNIRSGLSTATITGYVTTFWLTVAFRRIWETLPRKFRSGYASTVKRTGCPTFTVPMSDSETSAETCILVRSCAIVKRVGAWNEAATVCPTSYCRATTTPSIGATIFVYFRSVSACFNVAAACCELARAES